MLNKLAERFLVVDPHVHVRSDGAKYEDVAPKVWDEFPELIKYYFKYKTLPEGFITELLGSESAIESPKRKFIEGRMNPGFYILPGDHNSDGIAEWLKYDGVMARELTVKDNGKTYHIMVADVNENNWEEIKKILNSNHPLDGILEYLKNHFGWVAHPLGKIHRDGISITSLDEMKKFEILEINGSHPWYENVAVTLAVLYLGKGMIAGSDAHHEDFLFRGATISDAKSWDEFKRDVKNGGVGIYLEQHLDGVMDELRKVVMDYHGRRILKEGLKRLKKRVGEVLKNPKKADWKDLFKTAGGLAILEGLKLVSPFLIWNSKRNYYNGTKENSEKIIKEIYERLEDEPYENLVRIKRRTDRFIDKNAWWFDKTPENEKYANVLYDFVRKLDTVISRRSKARQGEETRRNEDVIENYKTTSDLTPREKRYISRVFREMELAYYVNEVSPPREQIEDMYKLEKRRGLVDLFYAWKKGEDDKKIKKRHRWLRKFENLDDFVYQRLESLNDYFTTSDKKYAGKLAGILRYAHELGADVRKYLSNSLMNLKLPYAERNFIKIISTSPMVAYQIQATA